MIEPNYDSLTLMELQHLCHERKIIYGISTPKSELIATLLNADYAGDKPLWPCNQ